jgi:hypothetical protein
LQRIDRRFARTILGDRQADRDRDISESEALDLAERGLLLSCVLNVSSTPYGVRLRNAVSG